MRYRELGASGVVCSEIGFGVWTMTAGWWGTYTDDEAIRLLREAHDLGVTVFDTAPTYGEVGRGETVLARALGAVREDVVYSTKFGYDTEVDWSYEGHRARPHRTDVGFTRRAVEDSLRRLDTDVIDILQLHNPTMSHIEQDDLWALLADLKAEGKLRAYGASIGPKIGWRDEGLAALTKRPEAQAFMMIHNLLEQDPGRDFLAAARGGNAGVMVRVPHSSGLLEGKYTADTTFDANDHRAHRDRAWLTEGLRKLERLDFLAQDRTIGQAAISWLLADPLIATVLPNIYDREQLAEFVAASDMSPLPPESAARVSELYDTGFEPAPN